MNLASFSDELLAVTAARGVLVKTARGAMLHSRLGAIGALAGLGAHGLQHGKSMVTGNPYDAPLGTAVGATVKTGVGGLAMASIFTLLARMGSKGKR